MRSPARDRAQHGLERGPKKLGGGGRFQWLEIKMSESTDLLVL